MDLSVACSSEKDLNFFGFHNNRFAIKELIFPSNIKWEKWFQDYPEIYFKIHLELFKDV